MKDIDFDELDRAVNSLINKPTSDSGANNQPTPAGPVASSPVPVSTTPSVAPVTTTASPAAPSVSSSPADKRSSGRFMDVVHPSSDMRPAPPAKVPTREGMTINPTPVEPVTPSTVVAPTEKSWPDPIDLHEVAQKPQPNTDATMSAPPAQDSPFLSNAKVEKRPLGAFSDTPQPTGASATPETTPADKTDRSDHPIGTDTPLPAELQNDLLSVEDNDAHNPSAVPAPVTEQYTEQPSTSKGQTDAIFNTEAYHKPLAHPKKRKSGWLIVMWIFVLLVVGAGSGAAVYFYVLPLL